MTDYDLSIHTNPDAMAWTKFFIATTKNMDRSNFEDEGYMVGWFANAMMAMHDHLVLNGAPINGDHAAWMMEAHKKSGDHQ